MKVFFQHINHQIGSNHDLKKIRELDFLENKANSVLLRGSLLGYVGVEIEEKNNIRRFVLTGEIKDDKEVFQRISAAILKITEETNINVVYGLEKRGNILIFRRPIQSQLDVAEYILRYYPELDRLNIRLEEDKFPRFILTGTILDDQKSFEKFKAAIEQISDETNLKVVYGLRKEGKYLIF